MLKGIPSVLSPELLKVLAEMGHSDRICIGDGNFPGSSMAKAKNAIFLRADGHGVPEILDAILQVFPLDTYVEKPAILMEKMECDKDLTIPVCMHNVPTEDIFRPAAWNAFGMDKEGADYRACAAYGPMYKAY